MNGTKEVEFRNYDETAGFFYDDTVVAFVWDNDLAMCEGYWVVDKTTTIGDKSGQNAEQSHQIVISGDVKLIVEDGISLTMRWDDSWKLDAAAMSESIGDTVADISAIVSDAIGGDWEGIATDVGTLVDNLSKDAAKVIDNNKGTGVAMISVCEGAALTVYGQENGTGKLDIAAPSKSSGSNEGGAAIGGDNKSSNGDITINGAQVIASSKYQSAAIGGGGGDGGGNGKNITVNGGYVNATHTGDNGAAIGGGRQSSADNITINSGYVSATTSDDAKGAAIGSGDDKIATNITINGGYVYAKTSDNGAAIGTGYGCNSGTCGYFTVNNGYVGAYGAYDDNYSPAIGKGKKSDCSFTQLTINGGRVYCKVKSDKSAVVGAEDKSDWNCTGLYFKGVYLNTGKGNLGYQDGTIDYFTNGSYEEYITDGSWLESYSNPVTEVSSGTTFAGDKTSASGYYADTVNGGFYHVASGYYFANTETASITGLNNNGFDIKGGAISNEGGCLDLYSVTISSNKSVSNGSAKKSGSALGGAIYANGDGYTVVSCSKFENNVTTGATGDFRGGAIASEQDILTVTGSIFNSNKTTSKGGAIWANGTNVVIDDSEFGSNYASRGGAIYAEGVQSIVNGTFTGNLAGIDGGAVFAATGSTVIIISTDFEANRAHSYNYDLNTDADKEDVGTHRGGAVYVDGDRELSKGAAVQIAYTDFTNNYAKQGGALYVAAYGNATVTSADFIGNEAGIDCAGGAIYVEDKGTLTLNDVYFSGNRSTVKDSDGNVITEYCAIYNDGEINFTGTVTVDPYKLDKMYNRGWINWDLTGGQSSGYFSDMTLFINEVSETDPGKFGITVNADDIGGISRYVLGRNANFAEMPASLTRFVLRGVEGQEDREIYLNGEAMEYNGKMYSLTSSDKAGNYYEIALTVTEKSGTPARTGHIVVNQENYTKGILTASGNFKGFDFGETEGGIVLVEDGGTFEVHDSTFTENKAVKGGAIYARTGGSVVLTDVTFNGNLSEDGQSGAIYIENGASAIMYGDVTLSSTADTVYNAGELVWDIGLTTQGYISDFSRIVNEGSFVVECNVDTQYGKYILACSAKTAVDQVFTVRDADGNDMELTVNGSSVANGNYVWKLYVDPDEKYALCMCIEASRIVVRENEQYTLSENYSIDMNNVGSYEGNGQIIEVWKGGCLSTADSARIAGCSATVSGGAIWNKGTVSFDNARFFKNEAESGSGGAIYDADNAKLTISNSIFRSNTAGNGAGGAIADDAAGTITVTNTTFADNSAKDGGAVAIANGQLNLAGVTFNGNTATGSGGAISVSGTGSVNLYGSVALETDTDTIDLGAGGKLVFNLSTANGSGYISDLSKVTGVVSRTITVNVNDDDETSALYVLADNVSDGYDGIVCTVCVPTSTAGTYETKEIAINQGTVSCGDHYYSLKVNDEDQLVLQSLKRLVVEEGEECVLANDIDIDMNGADVFNDSGMLIEVRSGGTLKNTGALKFANCRIGEYYSGGAIRNIGTVILDNAEFTGNIMNPYSCESSYVSGGGAIASTGDLTISNSTFYSNEARDPSHWNALGGAIYQVGGTISVSDTAFTGNKAGEGGAIYAKDTELTLSGEVTFSGNDAHCGGAISLINSTLTIAGNVYLAGSSDKIYVYGNSAIEWIVGRSANGYVSDFSKLEIDSDNDQYHFTIDATSLAQWDLNEQDEYVLSETPALGRSYLLADNASNASGYNKFTLKVASGTYGMSTTYVLTLDQACYDSGMGLYYTLALNSGNELVLNTVSHIVVNAGSSYTMNSGDNYNWSGIAKWEGNGTVFEVLSGGTLESTSKATVQNGYASGNGGAVYNAGITNLIDTVFSSNKAEGNGGAVYNAGTAYLKGITFKNNTVTGNGGAVFNAEGCTLSVGGAVFNGNTAVQGGAIYNAGTLNITGKIMLETATDTIVSEGSNAVINWALDDTIALTKNTDFSFSDFSLVTAGNYSITLKDDSAKQMSGLFKLASNAANGITVTVGNMSGQSQPLTVDSANRIKSVASEDRKFYYELLLDDNNELYFTVDTALFLNDSWGDNETGISATFHGSGITGSTGDGTFFNTALAAEKQALTTNSAVIVYGLDHSTVVNLQSKFSLKGSVELSAEHVWLNVGTAVRDAVVNWDLTGETCESNICIKGFEYYRNSPTAIDETEEYLVRQTITVTDGQAAGNYVLAAGDLSDVLTDVTGKYDFSLVTRTDVTGKALTLNDTTEYNGRYYLLYVDDAGTADTGDDELILSVDTEAKITIKVDNTSVMYDGQNHKASYTVIGGNLLQSGDELQVTLSDTAGLTNAGSIDTISVSSCKVMRGAADVTGEYKFNESIDGSLKVCKRDVTITSASAEKLYDGTALVAPGYEITGSGFISGQGATINVTGSQTEIGSSENTTTCALNVGTDVGNYDISIKPGTLTVICSTPITITANSGSKMYDGTALSDSGYTYTDGVLLAGDVLTATVDGTITDAGTVCNQVTSYKVMRGRLDVTSSYMFNDSVDGILTVTRRDVTLTSRDAEKAYDGTPLTCHEVDVSGSGFVSGEGAEYTFTGSQTEVGTGKNTFTYTLQDNTKAGNYNITAVEGDLTVTEPIMRARSDIDGNGVSDVLFQWDGGDHQLGFWMNGTNDWKGDSIGMESVWSPVAIKDMNSDGMADVVMLGKVGGRAYIGYYDYSDSEFSGSTLTKTWVDIGNGNEADDWEIAVGNMTGHDGKNSIVFRQKSSGRVGVWEDGVSTNWTEIAGKALEADNTWSLVGTGDFDGNGKESAVLMDLYGNVELSEIDGGTATQSLCSIGTGWTLSAIGDFSNDGIDDIVFFNTTNGSMFMMEDGTTYKNIGQLDAQDWFVVGAGDYDGDQKDDLLVRQYSTGMLGYYQGANQSKWVELGRGVDMNWTVIA